MTINDTVSCLISADFADFNVDTLPPVVVPVWTVISVVNGLAFPVTVILNVLIIWIVMADQELRSFNYNLLLAALAGIDLLFGVFVQPLHTWYHICLLNNCQLQLDEQQEHELQQQAREEQKAQQTQQHPKQEQLALQELQQQQQQHEAQEEQERQKRVKELKRSLTVFML
ncbi:hypothetical protein AC249_AIPGENE10342 [Exaiptasia diaphana]|nr:hypothetical protein AC249_AIPGENE10342 [Exaiptasia diaphana]